MEGGEADKVAESTIERLRALVNELETTFDVLTQLGAFNLALAQAADEDHWRRHALDLRARLSVLF